MHLALEIIGGAVVTVAITGAAVWVLFSGLKPGDLP